MHKPSHRIHSFDVFTLDLTRGCLLRGTQEIKLPPRPFETLKYLVENPGRLISKSELIQTIWPDTAVTDDSLVQCLMEVRRALGDDAQQIIKTVPRRGYIFDTLVTENGSAAQTTTYTEETAGVQVIIEEQTDGNQGNETAPHTSPLPVAPAVTTVRRFTNAMTQYKIATAVASAVLATVVVAGVVYYQPILAWWFKPPSIAILPFVNATGDTGLDSAGDGLTEAVIQSLSRINAPTKFPRLLVAPFFSVSTFKGRDIDPRNAGREMGVDFVLAGKITQNDKILTTKVELIKVADGSLVWSKQNSSVALLKFMELPEGIAQGVAQKLPLTLSAEERLRLTKRYTQNAAAYEAFIKGHVLYWTLGPAAIQKSGDYFQQAIDLDPDFAEPYSYMGGIHELAALYGKSPPKASYQEANVWWAKALQKDASIPDVPVQMLVQRLWLDWDWEEIEISGKRTGVYGDYLAAIGRLDESLAASRQRLAWLPTSALLNYAVGFRLYLMHRQDEAIEQFKNAISRDPENWPAHFALGFTYSQKGMHEEAIAEMKRALELQENAPPSLAGLGYVYAVAGRRDEALKILNQLRERADRGEYVTPFGIAWIQIGLGDKEQTFAWLDKAFEDRSSGMIYLKVNPIFEPLRSDPRFTSLLQRMRFPR